MRRRPSSRLLVIDPDSRVLLFRFVHDYGPLAGQTYWATPGGGVEEGESFADAARRELFEETGIRVDDVGQHVAEREFVLQLLDGEYVTAEERFFCGPRFRPGPFAGSLDLRRSGSDDRASLVVSRRTEIH